MARRVPFGDNGEIDKYGYVVKIYQLNYGSLIESSISHRYYIGDVFCHNCHSKDYKNLINFKNYINEFGYGSIFCYDGYFSNCLIEYCSKKRERALKFGDLHFSLIQVEDIFKEWFMWSEIYPIPTNNITPYPFNGKLNGHYARIYMLYKGHGKDCHIYREHYIWDLFCYTCGSRDYKNLIDFSIFIDRHINHFSRPPFNHN